MSSVATEVHYPIPDHKQSAYPLNKNIHLPITKVACKQVVSLPCYPRLTDNQIECVIQGVKAVFKK